MARKFVVINSFTDLTDDSHVYNGGDFYPREGAELNEKRAEDLLNGHNKRNEKLIVEVLVNEEPKQEAPKEEAPEEPKQEEKPKKESKNKK